MHSVASVSFQLERGDVCTKDGKSSRMTDEVVRKLVQLAQACAAYDYKTAQKLQQDLANTDWTNTKEWHKGVRSVVMLAMIKSGGK